MLGSKATRRTIAFMETPRCRQYPKRRNDVAGIGREVPLIEDLPLEPSALDTIGHRDRINIIGVINQVNSCARHDGDIVEGTARVGPI
jgi:hypothetical protein